MALNDRDTIVLSDAEVSAAELGDESEQDEIKSYSDLPTQMAEQSGRSQPQTKVNRLDGCKSAATIVVLGRSGAGKSSLLNKVFKLGSKDDSLKVDAGTTDLTPHVIERRGKTLTIVDTIGLTHHRRRQELKKLNAHRAADLVIFCIPVGPSTKFEVDNPQLMKALLECYGQNIWRNCLVVFTFSNHAWDHVKKKPTATSNYTDYIRLYTNYFREELIKMGVEKKITDSVKCIFDMDENQDRSTIPAGHDNEDRPLVTIPAGYDDEDPILPGIKLDEEKWVGKLFEEMLLSASKESKRALLEFRYTREFIKQAYRKFKRIIDGQGHDTSASEPTAAALPTPSSPAIQPPPQHAEAREILKGLSSKQLKEVGVELGLKNINLKKMMITDCMLDEMLDSWLNADDDVIETSGHPSWQSLVQALEEAGYPGEAATIRNGT